MGVWLYVYNKKYKMKLNAELYKTNIILLQTTSIVVNATRCFFFFENHPSLMGNTMSPQDYILVFMMCSVFSVPCL